METSENGENKPSSPKALQQLVKKKSVTFASDTYIPRGDNIALTIIRHLYTKELGYTQYHIQVLFQGIGWTVYKRYRDFESLHKQLAQDLDPRVVSLPELPKKRWFEKQRWLNRFDDSYSYNRRIALQEYLRILARIKYIRLTCKTFQEFLQIPTELMESLIIQLTKDAEEEERLLMEECIAEEQAEAEAEGNEENITENETIEEEEEEERRHDEEEIPLPPSPKTNKHKDVYLSPPKHHSDITVIRKTSDLDVAIDSDEDESLSKQKDGECEEEEEDDEEASLDDPELEIVESHEDGLLVLDYDGYKANHNPHKKNGNGNGHHHNSSSNGRPKLSHRDSILETKLLQLFDDNGEPLPPSPSPSKLRNR